MKIKSLICIILGAFLLSACEPKDMGEITVEGTLCSEANPCPRGMACLPGMEVALRAEKIYYLRNIDIKESYDRYDGLMYFTLDGETVSERDRIKISGTLFEYIDKYNQKYYRIYVKDYWLIR